MSVSRLHPKSRIATLLAVTAAHGLVLWLIWELRAPNDREVETFTSTMFFVPDDHAAAKPAIPTAPRAAGAPGAHGPHRIRPAPAIAAPRLIDSGTAITLPSSPALHSDWFGQLAGAAGAALDKEARNRKQLGALTGRSLAPAEPRDVGRPPVNTFRWYDAGIHRLDTRGPLPVLHLNDRCVLLAFIIPACLIGHIDIHGDLFDGAVAAHGDTLAAPRPDSAP